MLTPIALRVLSSDSIGKRKLEANKFYYLQEGFDITDNGYIYVSPYRLEKDIIYQEFFKDTNNPDINISAIVGGNGSGKSSLIEFYMRLVNNFAATTLGEYQTNPGSEHLHYINDVEGEFYYLLEDIPYRLKVLNRNVTLDSYTPTGISNQGGQKEYIPFNTSNIFDNELSTQRGINEEKEIPMQEWRFPNLDPKSKKEHPLNALYSHFFYTYISNYSIYAYNTEDYHRECNSDRFEELIRKKKRKKYDTEYKNWLNGIFHKNDGYQTPIVLSPFRTKGNMDINTENTLSRERLISLLLMPQSQFRTINGHLEVVGFDLTKKAIVYDAKYLKLHIGFFRLQQKGFDRFKQLIVRFWGELIAEDLTKYANKRKNYDEAVGYLVYKTLKISKKYKQYHTFFKNHQNISFKIDEEALHKLVISISIDNSHITRKIHQILAYIVYGMYDYEGGHKLFDINTLTSKTDEILNQEKEKVEVKIGKKFIRSIEELIPPPIFDTRIALRDKENGNPVFFETLSSGERQQVYSISAFLYHLSNLDSVWNDSNKKRITYKHVNVIMEEIELYFHPELQRTYIKHLLEGIRQMQLSKIKSIHICFVTHSPFVLSDIPSRNILALRINNKDMVEKTRLSTFGANIHDMLKHSFFLTEGSIGAYADCVVKNIINEMEEYKKLGKMADETIIHEKIMLIDEPIIRMALLGEYHRVFADKGNEKKIIELQRQIDELKNK